MADKDLASLIDCDFAIAPAVETGNTAHVSSIIDTFGYESLVFAIIVGTLSDSGCTLTPSFEHGDDSALADTAVPDAADLVGTVANCTFDQDDDNEVRWIGYVGKKRYVRMTLTPASNAGNIPLAAIAIKGNPTNIPTTLDA
jgi:hypothetical protein